MPQKNGKSNQKLKKKTDGNCCEKHDFRGGGYLRPTTCAMTTSAQAFQGIEDTREKNSCRPQWRLASLAGPPSENWGEVTWGRIFPADEF